MEDRPLKITLFDRPPVVIHRSEWNVLAGISKTDGQGRHWRLTARRHADGRVVVYGSFTSRIPGEVDRWGGELLEPDHFVHCYACGRDKITPLLDDHERRCPKCHSTDLTFSAGPPDIPAAIRRVGERLFTDNFGRAQIDVCISDLPAVSI